MGLNTFELFYGRQLRNLMKDNVIKLCFLLSFLLNNYIFSSILEITDNYAYRVYIWNFSKKNNKTKTKWLPNKLNPDFSFL